MGRGGSGVVRKAGGCWGKWRQTAARLTLPPPAHPPRTLFTMVLPSAWP